MNELATIRKIEQCKLAIREVKNLDEIKNVIDQGEALKAYAKSAQMSADIAELNLIAERRLGEISAGLEKAKVKGNQHIGKIRTSDITKTTTLSSAGVTRQRASEAEKLAKIDEGVFNDLLKMSRKNAIPKTDIEKIARMEPEKQRAVADKISTGMAKAVSEAERQIKLETVKESLYGFADDFNLTQWFIGDLKAFRLWFNRELWKLDKGQMPGIEQRNSDGSSYFRAFEKNVIPGFIIAQSA